jgi:hypothetical protein
MTGLRSRAAGTSHLYVPLLGVVLNFSSQRSPPPDSWNVHSYPLLHAHKRLVPPPHGFYSVSPLCRAPPFGAAPPPAQLLCLQHYFSRLYLCECAGFWKIFHLIDGIPDGPEGFWGPPAQLFCVQHYFVRFCVCECSGFWKNF